MGRDDEYELLPRQEVENLKRELERLKKNPLGELKEGKSFLDSVNVLNDNIKKLIDIFTKAEADLAKEYSQGNPAQDLKVIKEQNEQIAQGLIAVADLVKDMKEPRNATPSNPSFPNTPAFAQTVPQYPSFQQQPMPDFQSFQAQMPPQPPFDLMSSSQTNNQPSLPPLPPPDNFSFQSPEKKRGLFSRK
ncbi:MAG: hypothetical protein V1866_01915 [archaeon]